ncbi:MAG: exonuclease domain-containing protein [Isosphaeraceae bacterium]
MTLASGPYVALDFETTGLSAQVDRIVEIGAVRFDAAGRELDRFEQLVNPERPMPPAAQRIHGIGDDELASAPVASEVIPAFLEFLGPAGESILLAHNAVFDASFLAREIGRLGLPGSELVVVDTLALARARMPWLPSHRLDALAHRLQLDPHGPHRALADSRRVMGLFLALEGPRLALNGLVAYPVREAERFGVVPVGWDGVADAIVAGSTLRLTYLGGSHGDAPRDVTPRGFVQRGGVAYLVALCHLDSLEKTFRLDRVERFEVLV